MAEHTEINSATHDNDHVQNVSSKQRLFHKSTTIGFGLGQPKRGVTDLQSPIISTMNTHNNAISDGLKPPTLRLQSFTGRVGGSGDDSKLGKPTPILPMFVQMNVRWHGVDKSWREASR